MTAVFNEEGFRDKEFKRSQEDSERIAIVGDSFVFGIGVEENETFVNILEQRMQEKNPLLEIYNLGVSGTYPYEYNTVIQEFSPILQPKIIIVSYYTGNDITCEQENISKGILINLRTLIKKLFMGYVFKKEKEMFLQSLIIPEEYKDYIQKNTIDLNNIIRQRLYKPNLTAEYYTTLHWFQTCKNNKQEIRDIKESASENNATLIVLIIPSKYQVTSEGWNTLVNLGFILNESLLTDRQLQDAILSFCEEQDIVCLDALPLLQESKENPYFELDTHFNRKGHGIISEMLFSYFSSLEEINQTMQK